MHVLKCHNEIYLFCTIHIDLKKKKLGIVAQTYNPSYFQGIDQKD
jgi:hypothetical protein